MKCQEVIELMQRYLDQDLDEMEYNRMLGHMQQCPVCTELFERLVALSHELEQLPKVTPAYSIVDSILPKLQQIDLGMPTDTAVAVTPAAAPLVTDAKKLADRAAREDGASAGRRRPRGLVSTRIVGGVVAAGLVLGFFIFQQQQQNGMKNADGLIAPLSVSAPNPKSADGKQTGGGAPAADTGAVHKDSAAAKSESVPHANEAGAAKSSQSVSTASPEPTKDSAVSPQASKEGKEGSAPKADAPAAQSDKPDPAASKKSIAAGDTIPQAAGNQGSADQDKSVPPPGAPSMYGGSSVVPEEPSSAERKSPPQSAAPDKSLKIAPTQQAPALVAPDAKQKAESMGISSIQSAAPHVLASPDGSYSASVSSDLHVIITDKQGATVFTSANKAANADSIVLVKWESDNQFSYELKNGSETTVYVIHVKDKTEVKK
ncbi:anti-sigma factor family protein [Paenibacillus piri]|uniref:Putative zinc-finger domain-containing protein n=1 Tax=Paenibacillus piri TaxID=2547395 RepID=A0A4R5KMD4_9BACL|nr:zf-HC2 domain-containing protein [Paenibacillus piri]TDF96769.1 hypothetical protein E1757_16975 [Paenibacillus piri]